MSAEALPTVDGRRARRDQNRERVVDAMLEIYREGTLQPSVAEVAERSGVSHRSVFRYFEDLDELNRVAIERQYRAIEDYLRLSAIGRGPLEKRIRDIVEKRLELYDVAAPVSRVGHMRAPVEPVLLAHIREMADLAVSQVEIHFAPELENDPDAEAVANAIAETLSMEAMEWMRAIRRLTRDQAASIMTVTVTRLLASRQAT